MTAPISNQSRPVAGNFIIKKWGVTEEATISRIKTNTFSF